MKLNRLHTLLSLIVFILSLLFLSHLTGCGGGSADSPGAFWQGTNDSSKAKAPPAETKYIFDPGPPSSLTIIFSPNGQPAVSSSSSSTKSSAKGGESSSLLWPDFLSLVASIPLVAHNSAPFTRSYNPNEYWAMTDGAAYSTDYAVGGYSEYPTPSHPATMMIEYTGWRPSWNYQTNKPEADNPEVYTTFWVKVLITETDGKLYASITDANNYSWSGDRPSTIKIFGAKLLRGTGDLANERYGSWKDETTVKVDDSLTQTNNTGFELRKFVIEKVTLQKEDTQGHTTPVSALSAPLNGEKIRIIPSFKFLGVQATTPENVRWEVAILDKNGASVLRQESPNPEYFTWDGNGSNGTPVPAGQYTFSLFAFVPEATWAEYKAAEVTEKRIEIISSSVTPSEFTIDQNVTISCTFKCYPENWPNDINSADVKAHLWDETVAYEYPSPIAMAYVPPIATITMTKAARADNTYIYSITCLASELPIPNDELNVAKPGNYNVKNTVTIEGIGATSEPIPITLLAADNPEISIKFFTATPLNEILGKVREIPGASSINPNLFLRCIFKERLRFDGEIKTSAYEWPRWRINIKKSGSASIIKQFVGSGRYIIDTVWDGKCLDGSLAPNGDYEAVFIATAGTLQDSKTRKIVVEGFEKTIKTPLYQQDFICNLDNDSNWPMEKRGCEVTSATMILAEFGYTSWNPISLNTYLSNDTNDGYKDNGNLKWRVAIDKLTGGRLISHVNTIKSNAIKAIEDNLNKTKDDWSVAMFWNPLASGYSQDMAHCVVARGTCRAEFLAQDPNRDPFYHLHEVIKDQITESVTVSQRLPNNRSPLEIQASSFTDYISSSKGSAGHYKLTPFVNFELCLTDDLNQKTGYDSTTQQTVNEIPNSGYLKDEHPSYPNYGAFANINLEQTESEHYKLSIIGTKTGAYIVDCTFYQNRINNKTYKIIGFIAPGIVHNFNVTVNQFNVDNFQVNKLLSPGVIGNSLQTAYDLSWIDNKGIFNSLTKKIEHAESSVASGKITTAINDLNAFINEIQAQSGKHIKKEAADILISDAQAYIKQLQP